MTEWRDPFNPVGGEFAANIRATDRGDLTELRQSMKQLGWIEQFPAIVDERDVVLVGHRRLAVAKELNIEPVIKKLTLGDGSEADAKRLKIAIASNIGFKAMTAADRQRIAKYLYGEREWTMQRIAKALNVVVQTISTDLANFPVTGKSNRAKTTSNPKGAGRPKGSGKPRKVEERHEEIVALNDAGLPKPEIADKAGVCGRQVDRVLEVERARRQGPIEVDPSALPMTAREKFDAALRQAKRKLEAEFEVRVREESRRRMNEISLPAYAKELEELEYKIRNRKGVMDRLTYRKILACLHPDRVSDVALKKRYEEAFRLFTELEKRVLDERESPTTFRQMPRTYEELMAMKAKVQAERKAKRTASKTAVRA